MKRGFKDIRHEKYSAPTKVRRKVDGQWTYERLATRVREFRQRVRIRLSAMSIAKRWAPYTLAIHASYRDWDQFIRSVLEADPRPASAIIYFSALSPIRPREKQPSVMAKKKFYVHRPKPANNLEKNQARRAKRKAYLIANERPMKSAARPGIPIMNAAQFRLIAAERGMKDHRRWTGDKRPSRQYADKGNGARECARRRRQIEQIRARA